MDPPSFGMEAEMSSLDQNLLSLLLILDADKQLVKSERLERGPFKGLYAVKKKINEEASVIITNGVEFPSAKAVEFLLYLIRKLEENGWKRELSYSSVNELLKEAFGYIGKEYAKRLKRFLVIWKNHAFYFDKSFLTGDGKLLSVYMGVIDEFLIEPAQKTQLKK